MNTIKNLPEFLYCEDLHGERDFVLHTAYPRFIIEFNETESCGITFIDYLQKYLMEQIDLGNDPAAAGASLMRQAGEFLVQYYENLDQDWRDQPPPDPHRN
jgi:hypothetical protein